MSEQVARDRLELRQPPFALVLVRRLVAALDAAGVTYCHWKSNESIARSASGENDLDLLVARAHAGPFTEVLTDLGFRVARPGADRQLPGIIDYYGFDDDAGRIVHVHAHFQLVLGDDMTKNFRLPIEDLYLRSATHQGLFPLPSPHFEYVVFVLRMVMKHSTWDAQLDRKSRLTASEGRELAYLEARTDPSEVASLVEAHLPFLDRQLFARCELAAAERVGNLGRAITAARLLHALRSHGRRTETVDLALRLWRRRWRRVQRRIPQTTSKKRLDTGGLMIALLGGDGSGKSTAVGLLVQHLSKDFDVRRFHMGKPPWSRLTRIVKRPMGRLRTYGFFRTTRLPAWHDFDGDFPGLAFMVWHVLTARDRYLEYRRARRAVARGTIAVCDRFPTTAIRLMDGPRTPMLPGVDRRPIARWLRTREVGYYAQMLPPDVAVVLRVPPDVAVERRHDEDVDAVRQRAAEVFDLDWSTTNTVVVNADMPIDDVHAEITNAVWAAL